MNEFLQISKRLCVEKGFLYESNKLNFSIFKHAKLWQLHKNNILLMKSLLQKFPYITINF